MKTFNSIFRLLILMLTLSACVKEYDAPPLNTPVYEGAQANITISELKQKFAAATDKAPITINEDLILKAYISANDESGNIYKQIFIQDKTAAIPVLVDQGGVFATYRVGQEVFINLKGMCVSVYGDEQQLGYPTGYLYRTPWVDFQEHVQKNNWPDKSNVEAPVVTDLSSLNANVANMTFRLVRLDSVYFVNGGKGTFASADGFGTEQLKDKHGNVIDVRTSNYADFAGNTLPFGRGSVVGILGRFRGSWQLTIPGSNDILAFDGIDPEESTEELPSNGSVLLHETFGTVAKVDNYWPKVGAYTGYDMKSPITYSDASGMVDIRSTTALSSSLWFTTGKSDNLFFTIAGVNATGYTALTLSYEIMANVYNDGESTNLNSLQVSVNGIAQQVPDKTVSAPEYKNKYETVVLEIPVANELTVEFKANSMLDFGFRVDNIKIIGTK